MRHVWFWFQSLIGKLKTIQGEVKAEFTFKFQSLIGRLKTLQIAVEVDVLVRVSIPYR